MMTGSYHRILLIVPTLNEVAQKVIGWANVLFACILSFGPSPLIQIRMVSEFHLKAGNAIDCGHFSSMAQLTVKIFDRRFVQRLPSVGLPKRNIECRIESNKKQKLISSTSFSAVETLLH